MEEANVFAAQQVRILVRDKVREMGEARSLELM